MLETVAHQSGFIIHAVPYDGNCMFSAVSHQLQSAGICSVESNELREMVTNHLDVNSALYSESLSQPVASQDAYNADTEPPTAEDEYINSVADSQLQLQLRWEKYLRCLRTGAWGDHIALQAVADMLGVAINVLCSHHPMVTVTPRNCEAVYEVFVGLIMQYHYLGLDNIPVCGSNDVAQNMGVPAEKPQNVQTTSDSDVAAPADALDDATIEERDMHDVC